MNEDKLPELIGVGVLAEPLRANSETQQVPLAIGIIATHPPKQVRDAIGQTTFHYTESVRLTSFFERDAEYHHEQAQTEIGRIQSRLEDELADRRQQAEETDSFDLLVELSDEHDVLQQRLAKPNLEHSVQRIYTDIGRAAGKQFGAEQRALELEQDAALAEEVRQNYRKLGRRGRIASYVAGALLAAGSIAGTAAMSANNEITHDQEPIGYLAIPFATVWAGFMTGDIGRDQFARRRAQRILRKS